MKKLILLFTLISYFSFAQTAKEIIDKHIAAVGGKAAVDAVISFKYEIYDGTNIVYYKKPGKFRIEQYDNGNLNNTTVYTGTEGWTVFNKGSVQEATDYLETQVKYFLPDYLVIASDKTCKIEYLGIDEVSKCHKIGIKDINSTLEYENYYTYYIDPVSYLITKLHINGYGSGRMYRYENYAEKNGLKIAQLIDFRSSFRYEDDGEDDFFEEKKNLQINLPLDDKLFEKPAGK